MRGRTIPISGSGLRKALDSTVEVPCPVCKAPRGTKCYQEPEPPHTARWLLMWAQRDAVNS